MLELYKESPLKNHVVVKFRNVPNQVHDRYPKCNLSVFLLSLLKYYGVHQEKHLMFPFLGGTIVVHKNQHQCRVFLKYYGTVYKDSREVSIPQPFP